MASGVSDLRIDMKVISKVIIDNLSSHLRRKIEEVIQCLLSSTHHRPQIYILGTVALAQKVTFVKKKT